MLTAAFDSGWVAPVGPDLDAFEAELAAFSGSHVAAVSSGTAALQLALRGVGVAAGDVVLVSDLTFAAPAFAAAHVGAEVMFVDTCAASWQMDPAALARALDAVQATGRRVGAVIAVDLYGALADHDDIGSICAGRDIPVVEDAAESIGAHRGGRHAGRFGRVGVWSFNGNKMLTTGGGGAVVSDDEVLVSHARHRATQARIPGYGYDHDEIGNNFRLGNLPAAIGRAQLRSLPLRIERRRAVHREYRRLLDGCGVRFQQVDVAEATNAWLTTIEFEPGSGFDPPDVVAKLQRWGIEARPAFRPLHAIAAFEGRPVVTADGGPAHSLEHFRRAISLPSGAGLADDDVAEIAAAVLACRG